MTTKEQRLIARLLDMAADKFSNHGCNDFDVCVEAGLTSEEATELDRRCHVQNGDPWEHEPDSDHTCQADFVLMHYFADRLRKDPDQ